MRKVLFGILSIIFACTNSKGEEKTEVTIPVIDISEIFTGTKEERSVIARVIGKACEDVGFFIIKRPLLIPASMVAQTWNITSAFFDLPEEEKQKWITADEEVYPFGYSPIGGEPMTKFQTIASTDDIFSCCR